MTTLFRKTILFFSAFISLSAISCYGKKTPMPVTAVSGIAVVELFTSEGCSSCPAAEAVLEKIQREYSQRQVYVLEFHVDYWDYIGWKDVYGDGSFTKRQQRYAGIFKLGSTYTPQAIVNGAEELVGSDNSKLRNVINSQSRHIPTTRIKLSAKSDGKAISVVYKAENSEGQTINIALVQKNATTNVKRGENSGKKLTHVNVVRIFKTTSDDKGKMILDLPPGTPASEYIVVAYAQDSDDWKVTGATSVTID